MPGPRIPTDDPATALLFCRPFALALATTTRVAIFLLAGVQLITVGLIGEYADRISDEVQQLPLYVVRQVNGREVR